MSARADSGQLYDVEVRIMKHGVAIIILLSLLSFGALDRLAAQSRLSRGPTVYVPVYSHIYYGDRDNHVMRLAATLSIRNIDLAKTITILSVDYYDTKGKLSERYLSAPVRLKSVESVRYIVKESDLRGGSGANFIVKWKADVPANRPIIEAVMIGARGQQGISFTSRGEEVIEK